MSSRGACAIIYADRGGGGASHPGHWESKVIGTKQVPQEIRSKYRRRKYYRTWKRYPPFIPRFHHKGVNQYRNYSFFPFSIPPQEYQSRKINGKTFASTFCTLRSIKAFFGPGEGGRTGLSFSEKSAIFSINLKRHENNSAQEISATSTAKNKKKEKEK